MNITAKCFKSENAGNLKGNASITLDNCFVVGNIRVMSGSKGLFVSMPSYKAKDGTYKDISFPLNKELRQQINDVVIAEYEKLSCKSTEVDQKLEDGDSEGFPF